MLRNALIAALLLVPAVGLAAEVDCGTSANQMDANICTGQELDRVDAELDRRYATLRSKLDENGRRNLVAAERAAGKHLHLEPAAGASLDRLGKLLHAHHDGVALGVLVGELDRPGLRLGGPQHRRRNGEGKSLEEESFHGLSPELLRDAMDSRAGDGVPLHRRRRNAQ